MTDTLFLGGEHAQNERTLTTSDLAQAPAEHQVPDVGALVEGKSGAAVRFAALAELAGPDAGAKVVHVESSDGGFTANLPLEQALAGGLVLYHLDGEPLAPKFGGPFRLLFVDNEDCSVNVKFLGRVEFLSEPGSHTARCSD